MDLWGTMRVNDRGHLEIGGCDTTELAREFGTPLYVFDEDDIRRRCRELVGAFAKYYPTGQAVYSAKAFLALAVARIMEEEGLGIEVVSGGELFAVLEAGFSPDKIYFTGNNKSAPELTLALQAGVGRIIVDNDHELETISRLAGDLGKKARVLLRLTPGVEAHTHHYIQTGQEDSKFGFDIDNGQAMGAVEKALQLPAITLKGIHCHIGSQIFDLEPFRLAARKMLAFINTVRRSADFLLGELDLGGGIGIRYTEEDHPPSLSEYVWALAETVIVETEERRLPAPRLVIEPGRAIVGESGTTLYTLGARKEIPGVRTYVMVDGGMGDNPRPALYDAKYRAILANKAALPPSQVVTVAGKCCESGDILIRDTLLPPSEPGDLLAVLSTGAYNHSMASNYNSLPRPAAVLVRDGRADLIIRRENYADIFARDLVPDRLARVRDLRQAR